MALEWRFRSGFTVWLGKFVDLNHPPQSWISYHPSNLSIWHWFLWGNCFYFRTFRFINRLQERIKLENQGSTVLWNFNPIISISPGRQKNALPVQQVPINDCPALEGMIRRPEQFVSLRPYHSPTRDTNTQWSVKDGSKFQLYFYTHKYIYIIFFIMSSSFDTVIIKIYIYTVYMIIYIRGLRKYTPYVGIY